MSNATTHYTSMTIEDLRSGGLIIYECISGSKAYGLDLPSSDTDIKGVFLLPRKQYYGLHYLPQVSDESNDTVFYELGRYIELLSKSNPNLLEMLATPPDKIITKHPLLNALTPELFLSKKCKDSFAGYAFAQIKKARGLNKKIVNPVEPQKKTVLEFCYVLQGQGSIPLSRWLQRQSLRQQDCGLVNIAHARDLYALFVDRGGELGYRGIMQKDSATTVLLSSVPKGEAPAGYLHFNQDGYVRYCKDYREYWDWVARRNPTRYENNIQHGKNYDSKNMMHTFRLLDMAIEILEQGRIIVERPNREELLAIRRGEWSYDALMEKAEQKMADVKTAYENSPLPEQPNLERINHTLVRLRQQLYLTNSFGE